MVKRKIQHFSIIQKYLLSYTIVFMLPLVTMSIICQYWVSSKLSVAYEDRYVEQLKTSSISLEKRFTELDNFAVALSQTKWLRRIAVAYKSESYEELFTMETYNTIMDQLKNYVEINGFVSNVAIYFPEPAYVIYKGGIDNATWFFSKSYKFDKMGVDDWSKLATDLPSYDSVLLGPSSTSVYNVKQRFYAYVAPLNFDINTARATVIFYINEDTVMQYLKNMSLTPKSYSLLFNNKNNELISYSSFNNEPFNTDLLKKVQQEISDSSFSSKQIFSEKLDKTTNLLSYSSNTNSVFKLITVYSEAEILKDVFTLKVVTIYMIIILFMICLILSYIMSRKNEKPIKRIISLFATNDDTNGRSNEFVVIENHIKSILQKEEGLEKSIEQLSIIRLKAIMEQLINGEQISGEDEAKELLLSSGFDKENFTVAILEEKSLKAVKYEALHFEGYSLFLLRWDKRIIVIINTDYPDIDSSIINDLLSILKCSNPRIGIGKVYDASNLYNSYNEAKISLECQLLKDDIQVGRYEDLAFTAEDNNCYYYPVLSEKLDKCTTPQDSYNFIVELLQSNIVKSDINLSVQRLIFYKRVLHETKKLEVEKLHQIVGGVFKNIKSLPPDEANHMLESIFKKLYGNSIAQKGTFDEEIITSVLSYIEENYTNTSFSLSEVADHFGISSSKLSILFKEKVGDNFVRYVSKKRLAKSKLLLKTTNLTIEEIGKESGFDNVYTFRRVFKKYESSIPSQFRESI